MIVFLTLIYVVLLFVLIKLKVLPNSKGTWLTTIGWVVVLFIFLFIPMQWGAPSGPVAVFTRTVQVIPNVSGQVIEVAAEPNTPLQQGDVLFRIDPEPYQIAVDLAAASLARVRAQVEQDRETLAAAQAQLREAEAAQSLAQQRFDDDVQLAASGTISETRLERRQTDLDRANAAVDQVRASVSRAEAELGAVTKDGVSAKISEAQAKLEQAEWNLDQTTARAPSEGYVTNLALTEGQRVTTLPLAPAMVFVDTSEKVVATEIQQNFLRHLERGQVVEMSFKPLPGRVVTGTLEEFLPVTSLGQVVNSGVVAQAGQIRPQPFIIRVALDDPEVLDQLWPGTVGKSAIYTGSVKPTHIIRKVMLRMDAILSYIRPQI